MRGEGVRGEGLEGMDDGLAGELGGLAFDDGDEIDEEAGYTDFKLPDHACRFVGAALCS